jgi:hypothetical protein
MSLKIKSANFDAFGASSRHRSTCCRPAWLGSSGGLAKDWRRLDEHIDHLSGKIAALWSSASV